MVNLAGNKECNPIILKELEEAGIPTIEIEMKEDQYEVPFNYIGVLGMKEKTRISYNKYNIKFEPKNFLVDHASFIFRRFWYYWVVTGYVPLNVAEEIYATGLPIRAGGDCTNPEPSKETLSFKICGHQVVNVYHIDSQEGLNKFVEILKKHNMF